MKKNKDAFFHLPRKVWDVGCIVLMAVVVSAVICYGVFYFVLTPKSVKIAVGLLGAISAFLLLLLVLYSYLPKVEAYWRKPVIDEILKDPKNIEYLRKIAQERGLLGAQSQTDEGKSEGEVPKEDKKDE